MINRLFSSTRTTSPQPSPAFNTQGIPNSAKCSTACIIVPFKLNPKVFVESDGSSIMLECRIFNETALDIRQCCNALTRIFYLFFGNHTKTIYVGSPSIQINATEATTIFFSITKAFQSKDLYLRRLLYLAIKCLSPIANDILMVISSITQDISSRADAVFRANAVRVLSRVIDISMLQGVERFVKQSLIEGIPTLSSSSLVSAIYWLRRSENTIHYEPTRRWLSSLIPSDWIAPEGLSRFHALALGYLLRQHDKGSLRKLLSMYSTFLQSSSSSPNSMAVSVLLVQICSKLGLSEAEFLPSWKSLLSPTSGKEMLTLEICSMLSNSAFTFSEEDRVASVQLAVAFISSSNSIIRFTAIRCLMSVATSRPDLLVKNHQDIEPLIVDQNRSVAIIAITILLKIGNESSIDRIVPHLKNSLTEMPESLKRSILEAMTSLAIQFPTKSSNIITFFASRIREEGDHSLKRILIFSIDKILLAIPSLASEVLFTLCEFIEDCEYSDIAVDVLHIIGRDGPKQPNPVAILRHIFNRLLLEVSTVRMAALGALIRFGSELELCRDLVLHLIRQRCLQDEDIEIRERALIFINATSLLEDREKISNLFDDRVANLDKLEKDVESFLTGKVPSLRFTDLIGEYSIIERIKSLCTSSIIGKSTTSPKLSCGGVDNQTLSTGNLPDGIENAIESLYDSTTKPGLCLYQSSPHQLTEKDTEYVVTITKYLYSSMFILKLSCTNTMSHIQLEDLLIKISFPIELVRLFNVKSTKISLLKGGYDMTSTEDLYYIFLLENSSDLCSVPIGTFSALMSFSMREIDFTDGQLSPISTPDEYKLFDVEIFPSDYLSTGNVMKIDQIESDWDILPATSEKKTIFQIGSFSGNSQMLVQNIHSTLGGNIMVMTDSTTKATPSSSMSTSISFYIYGRWLGKADIIVRGRIAELSTGTFAVELIAKNNIPSIALSDLLLKSV